MKKSSGGVRSCRSLFEKRLAVVDRVVDIVAENRVEWRCFVTCLTSIQLLACREVGLLYDSLTSQAEVREHPSIDNIGQLGNSVIPLSRWFTRSASITSTSHFSLKSRSSLESIECIVQCVQLASPHTALDASESRPAIQPYNTRLHLVHSLDTLPSALCTHHSLTAHHSHLMPHQDRSLAVQQAAAHQLVVFLLYPPLAR